jgi:hypothetical protein
MTSTDSPTPRPPAIAGRRTVSREGAPIRLERLTISQAVREAIERQFRKAPQPDVRPAR